MRRATIRDVGERAGVSTTTVSYVLNKVPNGRISQATKERVLKAAAELGYEPNAHARMLVKRKTSAICVVMPHSTPDSLSQPYFAQLLRAVSRVADEFDFNILLAGFGRDRDLRVKKLFQQALTDRFLVVGTEFRVSTLTWIAQRGARLALVNNRYLKGPRIWSATIDNVLGAYLAVKHLINLGHTRIGIMLGGADTEDLDQRLEGYRQALHGSGLQAQEELVFRCGGKTDSLPRQIGRLMEIENRPTALFATTDYLAIKALPLLRAHGLRIPQDLAIVGFDDAEVAAHQDPPLTTIRQPIEEIGAAAARFLVTGDEESVQKGSSLTFPVEIVIRGSCGFHR